LNGVRSGEEVFDGHRACGEFDPGLWTAYRVDGQPVGVLVMAVHSERAAWEVVYVGVVPEARGRGYGRAMLAAALHRARDARQSSVFLAVDCRNVFARAAYDALGFVPVGGQTVHLRLGASR
jgi:ribosomal protein S18 acetylase RimI-like enzyme